MSFDLRSFAAGIRVADGSMSAALAARGLRGRSACDFYNTLRPDAIEAAHRAFISAGAQILCTNTILCNRLVMDGYGAADKAAAMATAGVEAARRAAGGTGVKVLGALGPSGRIVMTLQSPGDSLATCFAEAAEALAWGGADAIVLMNFAELAELRVALAAVRRVTDLPVAATMTFGCGPERDRTNLGNSPEELARVATQEGLALAGATCGGGPDEHLRVVRQMRARTSLPILVAPNAGLPTMGRDRELHYPMTPPEFARRAIDLWNAGATVIGGCCGVMPGHVRALAGAL